MNIPSNLKYTKSDEWVLVEGNKATIGITDFAQDQLSDIVFLEALVDSGDSIKKGSTIATIESVKAAADVNCPISGTVEEFNEELADSPELVNSDPFGKAWMVKLEMSDAGELDELMDASAYEKYCGDRSH